jgi:hypothetical protein
MTLTFCLGNLFALHLLAFFGILLGSCWLQNLFLLLPAFSFYKNKNVCVLRMFFVVNIHVNVDVVVFFCRIVDVDVDFNQFCFWMMNLMLI